MYEKEPHLQPQSPTLLHFFKNCCFKQINSDYESYWAFIDDNSLIYKAYKGVV